MGVFDLLGGQLRFPLASGAADGFREAQVAAVHAIVGHFWDQRTPAIVVMPTGSGKTAVMLAAAIALRAKRVLVVAPSRLLREQLVEKFSALDPLRPRIGALDPASPVPSVVEVKHKLATKSAWNALRAADVVIGTPMTMSPKLSGVATPPDDLFDTIFFDEAHHVPAPSYAALAAEFPNARHVLFT
ncbi:MAG: DEAD/DEAH box helicase, partial [Kofleriaceae bacterium]